MSNFNFYYTSLEPNSEQSIPSQSLGGYVSDSKVYPVTSLGQNLSLYGTTLYLNTPDEGNWNRWSEVEYLSIGNEIIKVDSVTSNTVNVNLRGFNNIINFHRQGDEVRGLVKKGIFDNVFNEEYKQYRCIAVKKETTDGQDRHCLSFNGVNEYVTFKDLNADALTFSGDDISFSFWFKLNEINKEQYLVSTVTGFAPVNIEMYVNDENKVIGYFYFVTGTFPSFNNHIIKTVSTTEVEVNKWYLINFTLSNDNNVTTGRLYLNSNLEDTKTNNVPYSESRDNPAFTNFCIGALSNSFFISRYSNGYIDDLRIYNGVRLLQSNIDNIYNSGYGTTETEDKFKSLTNNGVFSNFDVEHVNTAFLNVLTDGTYSTLEAEEFEASYAEGVIESNPIENTEVYIKQNSSNTDSSVKISIEKPVTQYYAGSSVKWNNMSIVDPNAINLHSNDISNDIYPFKYAKLKILSGTYEGYSRIINSYDPYTGTFVFVESMPNDFDSSTSIDSSIEYSIDPSPSQRVKSGTLSPAANNSYVTPFIKANTYYPISINVNNIYNGDRMNENDIFYIWLERTVKKGSEDFSENNIVLTLKYTSV